jgi:hypothetical protein
MRGPLAVRCCTYQKSLWQYGAALRVPRLSILKHHFVKGPLQQTAKSAAGSSEQAPYPTRSKARAVGFRCRDGVSSRRSRTGHCSEPGSSGLLASSKCSSQALLLLPGVVVGPGLGSALQRLSCRRCSPQRSEWLGISFLDAMALIDALVGERGIGSSSQAPAREPLPCSGLWMSVNSLPPHLWPSCRRMESRSAGSTNIAERCKAQLRPCRISGDRPSQKGLLE